jgi:translation initiation factor 1
VRLRRESKGRGGKTVTIVDGLPGDPDTLKAAARRLKQLCGVGGSVKDGRIEIQGDHRERIAELLRAEGHVVKLAGG